MSYLKHSAHCLTIACVFFLSACDPLTDLLFDCIDNDGPVLSPRQIIDPVLNQSYTSIITASINNEPYDDRFRYDIRVSRGLPAGLTAEVFNREVRIGGAATELGTYSVTVDVSVEDKFGSNNSNDQGTASGLCRYNNSRTYNFTVRQGN